MARIGKPYDLATRETLRSIAGVGQLADEAVAAIVAKGDPALAVLALSEWAAEHEDDDALDAWQAFARADLAGRLFVVDVEIGANPDDFVEAARDHRRGMLALDAATGSPPETFLNATWAEAVEYVKRRGLMGDEGIAEIVRRYREAGVRVSRRLLDELQRRIADSLTRAVRDGQTLPEFAARMEARELALGFEPSSPWYVETVFRTTVQSAYGRGRFEVMTSPAIAEVRPIVEYRTVGDSRVRPVHAALDRKQWRTTDPAWQRWAPPNGFNCRCSAILLPAARAVEGSLGLDVSQLSPDQGFDGPPQIPG